MLTKTHSLFILGCLLSANQIYCAHGDGDQLIAIEQTTSEEITKLISLHEQERLSKSQQTALEGYLRSLSNEERDSLIREVPDQSDKDMILHLIHALTSSASENSVGQLIANIQSLSPDQISDLVFLEADNKLTEPQRKALFSHLITTLILPLPSAEITNLVSLEAENQLSEDHESSSFCLPKIRR